MPQPRLIERIGRALSSLSVTEFSSANPPADTFTHNPAADVRPRRRNPHALADAPLSLVTFYRAVQIDATAMCQLTFDSMRWGKAVDPRPALLEQPDLEEHASAFLEYTATSLKIDGNAFWLKAYPAPGAADPTKVVNLTALNPREVGVFERRDGAGRLSIRYHYRGQDYTTREVQHLKYLRIPGRLRGLGVVEAARLTFEGAIATADYGSTWLTDAQNPDGVLSTDQVLAPGDAEKYRHVWYGRNADGTAKEAGTDHGRPIAERLRVLGQGLKYEPILLKPADVQFLETQKFDALQIARLTGAPASLLLVAPDGGGQSYQNIEQEWIGYVRFTLMKIVREVEEAFTTILPRGQKARANLEALLRSDTKSRYDAHALAIDEWMTADEVRAIEGLPPLTDAQRAQIDAGRATRKPTPPTAKEPAA